MSANEKTLSQRDASKDVLARAPFMRACQRQPVEFTPIWLMRQAGRYMPEYREVRERVGFLDLCKNSELAAEVTVTAVNVLNVDAAIIFADILLPLESMGAGLEYVKGDGPVLRNPVRTLEDFRRLRKVDVAEDLGYVMRSIQLARAGLKPNIPLIGFAGAPFTMASYLIEGGSSRHFERTKQMMYKTPELFSSLLGLLAQVTTEYLNAQIEAGAQAVQLFDSWVGCLGQEDYRRHVLPHVHSTISGITPGVPVIHFGTGNPSLLPLMHQAGGTVIGVDWRIELDQAWQLFPDSAVQGNLDPIVLMSEPSIIKERAQEILRKAGGRTGHIFNLGHGILPQTPVDNVRRLVEIVHEYRNN
jgi:uroporphyrinogen decarboxylase